MSGGGLSQLIAYGAQDIYLTGNPQITFFKVVYRRHTNFAMEGITIPLTGAANLGGKSTVIIQRNGDLILQTYLHVVLKEVRDEVYKGKFAWVRRLGHSLIRNVTMNIGGAQIDKHYGTWMDIWYELTHDINQDKGYAEMIGDVPKLTELSERNEITGQIKPTYEMFIPFQFWFCRNPGLALPLIALQYHEVRIDIEFQERDRLYISSNGKFINGQLEAGTSFRGTSAYQNIGMQEAELLVNYVYLDSEERRRFAQVGHEYLIEQLQFTGTQTLNSANDSSINNRHFDLNFNHPTKELVWALKNGNYMRGEHFLTYSPGHTPDGWKQACNDAARNIANGMFVIDSSTPVPSYYTKIEEPEGYIQTNTYTENPHFVEYTITFVRTDTTTTVTDVGDVNLYLIRDVLTIGTYNLGDKIDGVNIYVGVTDDGGTDVYELLEVVCLKNSVTVRDISIPIRFWSNDDHDRRYIKDDIIVYQHHNYGLLIDGTGNPVAAAKIQLNGADRFHERSGKYFNYTQPYEHHTHTPADGINVYSFAIKPEDHQPSGTANLSRIDKTILHVTFRDETLDSIPHRSPPSLNAFTSSSEFYVFDLNYNVLRIMSGMGGIAYSN